MGTQPAVFRMVEIAVGVQDAEILVDQLWQHGVAGFEEVSSPLSEGVFVVRTSFGGETEQVLRALGESCPSLTALVREVPRSVADSWRGHVAPSWITPEVVIVPAWLPAPPGGVHVLVDPEDVFGLGNHPSTVLAARLILAVLRDGDSFVDVGCGSGVLSLVARLLKRASCHATDIAPQCRDIVARNFLTNGLDADEFTWCDSIASVPWDAFDVVCANILAPVLREFSGDLARMARGRGAIILSGMRADQVDSVVSCFNHCVVEAHEEMEGWSAVAMRKIANDRA